MHRKTRTPMFSVFCVLDCFSLKFVLCDIMGQEGKTSSKWCNLPAMYGQNSLKLTKLDFN